ncbi:efflux RND transporter periplasmic adaptor subunit [Paraliomyxa miuraensis]|nr:efflux RND transporter periplasmic adaptor subunit [Paraliomyxa miuraensis]
MGRLVLALVPACHEPVADQPQPRERPSAAPNERAEGSSEPVVDEPSAYVGVVISPRSVDLSTEVPGTVVELGAALGQPVVEGALLVRVQTPTLSAEIEAADAALNQVEAARVEQKLLIGAAERELAQEQQLASAGIGTAQERARAQLELDRARAVEQRLTAQHAQRRAELRRLHVQRDTGRITAPFSGTVSTWYQPEGAVVSPGDRLVRLVVVDRLWVRFAVPVDDLHLVRPGGAVDVLPVPEGRRLRATIRHVAPELDLASQRMLVEAELHDARTLKAGQACHVSLRSAASRPKAGPVADDHHAIVASSTEPTVAPEGM